MKKSDHIESNYSILKRAIIEHVDRNHAMNMLNQDTIRLLSLFNAKGRTLIPNLSMGELALCADEWDGYSLSENTKLVLKGIIRFSGNMLFQSDFLEERIQNKYESIVLYPPFGVGAGYGRSAEVYLEKSLGLLAPGGRLVALVPQNVTSAPAFQHLREFILRNYSLNAVISVKRIGEAVPIDCSILIIENKAQIEKIYMSLGGRNADTLYQEYIDGQGGFFVSSTDVYDRIDANYYDPKYKETRELVRNRDTVKLGDLADVFCGMMIPSTERKNHGDYLVIKPQYIYDGKVHLGNNRKVFCTKEVIDFDRRGNKCILKTGDVLISMVGKINWAIYTGDEDFAVANQNVAIIRGQESSSEWLRLFFHTDTGVEYLESQLKFFSHCGTFNHISISSLMEMAVPDIRLMTITDQVREGKDLEAKVATLFKELGWDVKEEYGNNLLEYDIALFFNNELRGIVEVKSYKAEQLQGNSRIVKQLQAYQKKLGDVSIYLFVDNDIYEYFNGSLEQLAELPRPDKCKTDRKKEDIPEKTNLTIEKKSINEMSLTDKMLLETATRYEQIIASLNRIENKVDDIAKKIELLSKQISGFQHLVDRQLEMAATPAEEERIHHAFSEECTERIIGEVAGKDANKEFNDELQKLILSFGVSAWEKMDESSQRFLISSKVIFNKLIGMQDIVDYSGVCLLVTKALEVEMGKRFCKNFIAYLKDNYPGRTNHQQFPTALLDRYGTPMKPKYFTLGSVAYVLCLKNQDGLPKERIENNKSKLLEYSRKKLFSGKTDEEISNILYSYADSVEEVKKDYRNPSAHTNKLHRVDAEQCFALVIDVEKLLKKMLDSFDE